VTPQALIGVCVQPMFETDVRLFRSFAVDFALTISSRRYDQNSALASQAVMNCHKRTYCVSQNRT
jgi:hypothetical protein